jgi:hypothetical protein
MEWGVFFLFQLFIDVVPNKVIFKRGRWGEWINLAVESV